VLVWIATAPRARALFTFPHRDNDGADQIIVTGTYSIGEDTNVFAQRVKKAALTQTAAAEADYTRRAGLISVEASVQMNVGAFIGISGQNYADPSFTLSFTKGQGRTTGTLSFTAAKSNAPDPVANNRAIAWNYSGALALRYPIFDRYFFTNTTTVGGTSYENRNLFSDQQVYSDALAFNVKYDSKLDLNTGYTIAASETSDTNNIAQNFLLGGTGTILPKLTGSLDLGYAYDATYTRHQKEQTFSSLTGNGSLKWAFSRTLTFSADASKAFGISSTDVVTDTTSAGLIGSGNIGKRFRTDLGIRYVGTNFVSKNGLGRRDTLIEVPADIGTALTTHVRVNLNYTWMENYSNLFSGKFVRETLTLTLIATY
jgi:hypothetical protein